MLWPGELNEFLTGLLSEYDESRLTLTNIRLVTTAFSV